MRGKFLLSLCLLLSLPVAGAQEAKAFDWLGKIAIDADELSSEDPQLRLKAVRNLQNYAIEWTQEYLLEALSDANINVRSEAGRALAESQVPEAIPIIISWLAEPDNRSKEAAAEILGEMKAREAIPALVRSLGDPDFTIRLRSTIALGKIGGTSVTVPLVARLEDTKSDVRLAAVEQLKALGDKRSVIPLVGLFKDPSLKVRVAAHDAVGELEDKASVPALLRSLDSRDERIVLASITSLGNLKALSALQILLSKHSRSRDILHGKISYSLAQIAAAHANDPLAQRVFVSLINELGQNKTMTSAREALRIAGGSAVPALLEQLQGRIPGDATATVAILIESGDERATDALISELDRGRIPQKLILSGLEKIGDPRSLMPVLSLLQDSDPSVRLRAMRTLGTIVREDSAASDVIAERLSDTEPEIRHLAISYLGRMQSKAAAPALETIVKESPVLRTRALALSALARIRSTTSKEIALTLLRDGPSSLRPLAADLLSEVADSKTISPLLRLSEETSDARSILAIQVLGASLRGKKNSDIEGRLRRIAVAPSLDRALAAIEAMVAMDADIAPLLRQIASTGEPERRRAAIVSLGAIGDSQSRKLLKQSLTVPGLGIAAAAAWSLAEVGDSSSKAALLQAVTQPKADLAINASAALARMATDSDTKALTSLLHHHSILVRVNALIALSGVKNAPIKRIETLATKDSHALVRTAAFRALSRLGQGKSVLKQAIQNDRAEEARKAAKSLLLTPFAPKPRDIWKVFRLVNPDKDDVGVPRSARYFIGADGLATVSSSDSRGRITYEHFPGGEFVEGALDAL